MPPQPNPNSPFSPAGRDWLTEVEVALRHNGQRMTKPRRAVLGVLAATERPLKAEDIRQSAGLAVTDLVTVYRNLETLRALGVLQRIVMEDGVQLFEPVTAHKHHHHLICRECHQTLPLEVCFGAQLESHAEAAGFSEVEHIIEVFGRCAACSDNS